MFATIPPEISAQMRWLETIDARDRTDGTARLRRLRQIPRDTGRFLAILAAAAPEGAFVEIGASAGYSALWLALACRERGSKLVTFEILEEKARLAGETFRKAKVGDVVTLIAGDARTHLSQYNNVSFCFLDAEKNDYLDFYDLIVPKMISGGLLAADNVISHRTDIQPMLDRADSDERVDSVIVPIGKGVLLARKL